ALKDLLELEGRVATGGSAAWLNRRCTRGRAPFVLLSLLAPLALGEMLAGYMRADRHQDHGARCRRRRGPSGSARTLAPAAPVRLQVGPGFGGQSRPWSRTPPVLGDLCLDALEPNLHPLPDHSPFEFGESACHLEPEAAHGCGRINVLLIQVEIDAGI